MQEYEVKIIWMNFVRATKKAQDILNDCTYLLSAEITLCPSPCSYPPMRCRTNRMKDLFFYTLHNQSHLGGNRRDFHLDLHLVLVFNTAKTFTDKVCKPKEWRTVNSLALSTKKTKTLLMKVRWQQW